MDLSWGKGVASTDGWAGRLDGAQVALESHRVTHLIVRRGLLLPRRFVVPLRNLVRWDWEGLYLDISITGVLSLPRQRPLDDNPAVVALTSHAPTIGADGVHLRLKGVRLSQGDHSITHLVLGRRGPGRESLLLSADRVAELGPRQITLSIGEADLDRLTIYLPDPDIEDILWEALHASEDLWDVDVKGVRVRVDDSVVHLEGNVRTVAAVADAERLARSTDGVADVVNGILSDWDLDLAVASNIAAIDPQLSDSVVVHTQLGKVIVEGHVPTVEAKDAIVQGVRSIPGVQSVQDRVEVSPPAAVAAEEVPIEESPAAEDDDSTADGASTADESVQSEGSS